MANDIVMNLSMKMQKGYLDVMKNVVLYRDITADAPAMVGGTQKITSSTYCQLDFGEVTTLGWAMFRNLDSANFVQLGAVDVPACFMPMIRLYPGDVAILRLTPDSHNWWYGLADTADVLLERVIFDA